MSQVSKYPIQKDVYDEIFNTFLQTIASLNTKREVLEFFNEFLTPTEKVMFSKRLATGLLISEGYDYKEILMLLKTSTTTIATFSTYYKYGESYKKIIDKIKRGKEIRTFLLNLGEKIAAFGSFGGKGSNTWRSVRKELNKKKSKLL